MEKTDEELIKWAMGEMEANLRGKIAEFRGLDEREELNINKIDVMWTLARRASDEVLREVYQKLANSSGEKKLIKKKGKR